MKKDNKQVLTALAFVTQYAIIIIVPIVLCLFVGKWLDKVFSKDYTFTLIFILLGIGASYRNAYIQIRNFIKKKNPQTNDEEAKKTESEPINKETENITPQPPNSETNEKQ